MTRTHMIRNPFLYSQYAKYASRKAAARRRLFESCNPRLGQLHIAVVHRIFENRDSTGLILVESTRDSPESHNWTWSPVVCDFGFYDFEIDIASAIAVRWRWRYLHQLSKNIHRYGKPPAGGDLAGHSESPQCLSAVAQEAEFPQQTENTQACRLRLHPFHST